MIPTTKLNSGYEIPMIGYGCFGGNDGPEQVYNASKVALDVGYRHFDTAYVYGTEGALGDAIKESKVPRDELFITTKLWQSFHKAEHVRPVFDRSLKNLKTDYVDLYLMHWPFSWEFTGYDIDADIELNDMKITNVPVIETWREMEKLVKDGKARSIGVSNFTIPMLEELLSQCEIRPAMNQVEIHPALPQEELVDYCLKNDIMLTAYSPLGNPGYSRERINALQEQVVQEIAAKYNKSPVQVILNWGANRGYCVIPKSTTASRIKDNFEYFEMDPEDIDAITAIGKGRTDRVFDPAEWWGPENNIFVNTSQEVAA